MNWLVDLFFRDPTQGVGVAHAIIVLAIVIAVGLLMGKIKIAGVSFGVTWILFCGIAFSHFGLRVNGYVLDFIKEFGLILFVYSIGLQVGPGFFGSLKKGGLVLNGLAMAMVALGVLVTCAIHFITGIPMSTMVGVMSGAVTNTPGLGAAQQAYYNVMGVEDPSIAAGYAMAYPLAVAGLIITIVAIKHICKINLAKEHELLDAQNEDQEAAVRQISLKLENAQLDGKSVGIIHDLIQRNYVISRVKYKDGTVEIPHSNTILHVGDEILVVTSASAVQAITAFLGNEVQIEWKHFNTQLISRKILITKPEINGKTLLQSRIRSLGVNITRVSRSGIELVARSNLQLHLGDRVTVVGTEAAVREVEKILGNSLRFLHEPNLFPIFLGIALGVLVGSIPITFPGIPQPARLGLAGGPLIVAILISRYGSYYKVVTYIATSANFMLRDIGIMLFLACVGLGAGQDFISVVANGGYKWIGYGVLITVIPALLGGIVGRVYFKLNYFTLSGLISGAITDPPALAYSNSIAGNDIPSVSYATVYPLTMFMRILCAQVLILIAI